MLRSKSRDRIGDGSGLYMNKTQMGEYLHDLRNNRPTRPTGARPPPPSSFNLKRYSTSNLSQAPSAVEQFKQSEQVASDVPPRCSSAQSFHKKPVPTAAVENRHPSNATIAASMAGRPLARPPQMAPQEQNKEAEDELPYLERGQRWLERQEAHSLRRALEDMDLREEQKVFEDAQNEAADLVWKHQNPNAAIRNPTTPFKNPDIQPKNYREHLRQGSTHARTASWTQAAQDIQQRQIKLRSRESSASRSASGGSKGSSANSSRIPSDGSLKISESPTTPNEDGDGETAERQPRKRSVQFVEPPSDATGGPAPATGQIKNGLKKLIRSRTPSPSKALQPQMHTEAAKIQTTIEEVQEQGQVRESGISAGARVASTAIPTHFRNPFSRARESKGKLNRVSTEPMPITKPLDRFEIQRNPPTQSRNPMYTTNNDDLARKLPDTEEDIKMKDGLEIRSDDIRKATSASLKDRSQKLPTPTMVSDSPGRPIVSFQKDWKPKEVELKQEVSAIRALPSLREHMTKEDPIGEKPLQVVEGLKTKPTPTIDRPLPDSRKAVPARAMTGSMQIPSREREKASPPPAVLVKANTDVTASTDMPPHPRTRGSSGPSIPVIAINDIPSPVPTIAINDTMPPVPMIAVNDKFNVPTISINDAPSIAITAPSIAISGPPASGTSTRPLPTPKGRPGPRHAASAPAGNVTRKAHITPTGHFHSRGTGALCENCALPIAGRIVSAAGVRFHPECFRCHHCGEGLECVAFYPEPDSFRLDRVNRIRDRMAGYDVGGSPEEDGDETLRFYCHLDYHEFFSPRCKSCKTPIEGEVVVACGAEWHVGHFFCAQCGDPFDDKTPFVEKDGYAWCVNCHTNRYSTKCKKCKKPVTDTVVKALNAEWHEQCFCCTECNGRFDDGRYFIRPGGMDPYCPACEERRLKA